MQLSDAKKLSLMFAQRNVLVAQRNLKDIQLQGQAASELVKKLQSEYLELKSKLEKEVSGTINEATLVVSPLSEPHE